MSRSRVHALHVPYVAFAVAVAVAFAPLHINAQTTRRPAACPPAGYSRANLNALKAAEWAIPDDARRDVLARALTACLGVPDPTLRDGIAFEALQAWLRADKLTDVTKRALLAELTVRLKGPDGAGFERPFAALVLSEVARADRIHAYLDSTQRLSLVTLAATYLSQVRDYRGFDQREGWRHGVAHGSDLILQLTLNPSVGKSELIRLRDAIASQIAPTNHTYIYGKSERLARPILYMAQRGVFTEVEWTAWLRDISAPGPIGEWKQAFSSQIGLSRRHNVNAFLQSIFVNAKLSPSNAFARLLPGTEAAIREMP